MVSATPLFPFSTEDDGFSAAALPNKEGEGGGRDRNRN